jgi:hypothetical protein
MHNFGKNHTLLMLQIKALAYIMQGVIKRRRHPDHHQQALILQPGDQHGGREGCSGAVADNEPKLEIKLTACSSMARHYPSWSWPAVAALSARWVFDQTFIVVQFS